MTKEDKFELIKKIIAQSGYQCHEVRCLSHLHKGHAHFDDSGSHFEAFIQTSASTSLEKMCIQKQIMKHFIDHIPQTFHSLILTLVSEK